MCREIECQCIERQRVFVCIGIDSVCGERDGIGPVTVRVWHRIGVRLRVIMHFVRFFIFWHFVRIPDTTSLIFINHIFLFCF